MRSGRRGQSRVAVAAGASLLLFAGRVAADPLPAAQPAGSFQELRILWEVHGEPAPIRVGELARVARVERLQLTQRRHAIPHAPRQRRPELASGQIAVTGIDARGRELGRAILPDPRILRSEIPDESGQLQRIDLVRPRTEFLVTLPDDPAIVAVRIYEPPRKPGSAPRLAGEFPLE